MKRIFSYILFLMPVVAICQPRYTVEYIQVCWSYNEVDSSLNQYVLVSSTGNVAMTLFHTNAANDTVDVSAGGTFAMGYCGCCDASDGSGADGDWAFVDTTLAAGTINEAIYRWSRASINTQDTSHWLRVDSSFQFNPDDNHTFDYQYGTDPNVSTWTGLFYRAPGTLGSPENYLTIADNSGTQVDRSVLGILAFAGIDTSDTDYYLGAYLQALRDGVWTDSTKGTSIDVYGTAPTENFTRNTFTFQGDGRLELDRYITFDDDEPLALLGYQSQGSPSSKDVTKHTIDGTSSDGAFMSWNAATNHFEWNAEVVTSSSIASGSDGDILIHDGSGFEISSNDNSALILPGGTTAERPAGAARRFRYNTDDNLVEFHDGSAWDQLDDFWEATGSAIYYDNPVTIGHTSNPSTELYIRTDGTNDDKILVENSNGRQELLLSSNGLLEIGDGSSVGDIRTYNEFRLTSSSGFLRFGSGNIYVQKSGGNLRLNTANSGTGLLFYPESTFSAGSYADAFKSNRYEALTNTTVTYTGYETNGTNGGDVIVKGGQGIGTSVDHGDLFLRGGNPNGTELGGSGFGGAIYLGTYAQGITSVTRLMTFTNDQNITFDNLAESEYTSNLVLSNDTLYENVIAYAEIYILDTDPDTLSITASTPDSISQTTAGDLSGFTHSNGRLTYTGNTTKKVRIVTSITASIDQNATDLHFWAYKNGTAITGSKQTQLIETAGDKETIPVSCIVEFSPDDYLQIYTDSSNTGDVYIYNLNFSITEI